MLGTASTVAKWLLVEQPGAWGPASLPQSQLAPELVAKLQDKADYLAARLLLIRRPAAYPHPRGNAGRAVFFADSRAGRERILSRSIGSDDELATMQVQTGWQQLDGPLFLVCTHGRHDVCCALRGRPLAAAVSTLEPERTWECSHVGGDRFAGNALVLPHGLYYGRLAKEDAADLIDATWVGDVLVEHLRGRSSVPLPAQAAQHFARRQAGRLAITAYPVLTQELVEANTWRVVLGDPEGDLSVTVRRGHGAPQQLTCSALERRSAPTWELLTLEALTAA